MEAKKSVPPIAATHSDEVNMVTCQVAHSIFDIPRKIARLRSQSYLDAIYADLYRRDHLPIDVVISPELEVAEAALKRLSFPNAFESENFLNNQAQLLGLHIEENCPVVNTPLRQLTDLFSTLRVIVVGVRRHGLLFAPSAGDQLFCSDQVYLMCHTSDASRTMDVFGKSQGEQNRIILIGGGNVGLRIAKTLEESKHRVRTKIIEKNRLQAEFSAGSLERTIVLHGDGLDSGLLDIRISGYLNIRITDREFMPQVTILNYIRLTEIISVHFFGEAEKPETGTDLENCPKNEHLK